MTTPIYDYVKKYAEGNSSRFHMPGHKGRGALGFESYDITEIDGADVLYSPVGIIKESEDNLTRLYGTAHSFYSTEGSTLAIKAMLAIICAEKAKYSDTPPVILAARNVHKAFVYAAALLDFEIEWMYPSSFTHPCECRISADDVAQAIKDCPVRPDAVYLTSPDYLGNLADVKGVAAVCEEHSIPLLVDNAHGAYLAFLDEPVHPIALGATMCADSAHKTLPVLTGGAYLHVSRGYAHLADSAREALSLFASTSPSYLTLCSLDLCNAYIEGELKDKLRLTVKHLEEIKNRLNSAGFCTLGDEPLKLTLRTSDSALSNERTLAILKARSIAHEFSDDETVVLMASSETSQSDLRALSLAIDDIIAARGAVAQDEPCKLAPTRPTRKMSVRRALLSPSLTVPVDESLGRVCKDPTVSCPPAVPITVSGEIIDENAIALFKKYGVTAVSVVK